VIELHSCSYFCERPACIKTQRDEMRDNGAYEQGLEDAAKVCDRGSFRADDMGAIFGAEIRALIEKGTK